MVLAAENDIDDFIARRTASSGNERANFQLFAIEFCGILPEAGCPSRAAERELPLTWLQGFSGNLGHPA